MRIIDADAFREWWLENGENEYVYDTNAILDSIDNWPTLTQPNEPGNPCDLCVYNPPSSFAGKPCTYCPATGRPPEGEESKLT